MPILKLETDVPIPEGRRAGLLSSLSRVVAETTRKPERYVMVTLSPASTIMSGGEGGSAFVDIRSIGGLDDPANRLLSRNVCQLLKDSLGIPPERTYLNFTDISAGHWGWNGDTFG